MSFNKSFLAILQSHAAWQVCLNISNQTQKSRFTGEIWRFFQIMEEMVCCPGKWFKQPIFKCKRTAHKITLRNHLITQVPLFNGFFTLQEEIPLGCVEISI